MDTTFITTADIVFITAAAGVSFLLGGLRRLIRYIAEQRFETLRADADLRDHVQRSDEQIGRMRRLQEEVDALKVALIRSAGTASHAEARAGAASRSDPVKLARGGADIDTIMSRCKLSRAEAELVLSVHAPAGMAKAA